MRITKEIYGEYLGEPIYKYVLDNNNGLIAHILNYGGAIVKLIYDGVDVALGMDSFEEYLDNVYNYGVLIGRNSNRIENGEFTVVNKTYQLTKNNGAHNIHGGNNGFSKKIWNAEIIDSQEPSLVLKYVSPNGEEGFPGELKVSVIYTLTRSNALVISYEAESDCDTIFNMTNHTYFNLNGHDSGTIHKHKLQLNSKFYAPIGESRLPTGEVLSVIDTPFDFYEEKSLGESLNSDYPQILICNGIDHNFAIDGFGYRYAGKLIGDKTNISMEVYTDCAGIQVYTANPNIIDKNRKDGATYIRHGAVCLETQAFPNFTMNSHFPNGFIKKNEKKTYVTVYKFKK